MGGMSAFIPSRKDPAVNEMAFEKVREDKKREVELGFDGTWVAHPDLVSIAFSEMKKMGDGHVSQKSKGIYRNYFDASKLHPKSLESGIITESGVRTNIFISLQYISQWLKGSGAVAIHNLMEDAATAEISRSEIWHWIKHHNKMDDGRTVTMELIEPWIEEESKSITQDGDINSAKNLFKRLIGSGQFEEFLTVPAYQHLK